MVPKKRNRIPWGWLTVLLVAAGGGGYWAWYARTGAARANALPAGVQTGTAARGDISQKITATGVVAAQTGAKVIGTASVYPLPSSPILRLQSTNLRCWL